MTARGTETDSRAAEEETSDPAVWNEQEDDRTVETLRWLRDKRRAHQRQRRRDRAVLAYCVVLAVLGYGGGYAFRFLRSLKIGADHGSLGADLQRTLPGAFVVVALALAVLAARDALWRGPVVVSGPSAGWLLAQPVRRGAVLRPAFRMSAVLAMAAGALAATAAAVVLHVTGLASFGGALAALFPAGVCLPLLAVSLGMAVERRSQSARLVRRLTAPAALLLALAAGQTALAFGGHRWAPVEWAELWSGPWGWAAQPVVAVTGGQAPGWPVALVLLAAVTAAAAGYAHRDAAHVPNAQLRGRAATASAVTSGVFALELRAAKLAVLEAGGDAPKRRVRLPAPPHRYLIVVWRDLLALLRMPGRLGRAVAWTAAAAAAVGLGAGPVAERRVLGLAVGLLCGYAAVGALAEPARLETDDARRAAWSPFRLRTLMLHHAIVPAALGALLGLLAAVPYALAGAGWALLLMPLCAAPFAAAAVFGACRGPARTDLLFVGGATPMGGPGPFLFAAWYAAGPLVSVTGLTLVLNPALAHGPDARSVLQAGVMALVLTAGLLFFAGRSASRLVRH
ncbi:MULTISPECIES: DUF6297 family protein [Streptomyces]|uniref:Uncharacterized protein n=2 Tax=Streptomyces rimosus subsp. rimosus TaxID=132474 RepID=A0A8A1V1H6_STRR1|nr:MULTISPECIES: DUF6297 family protein [Streptomyces]KOG70213.1 hypothetical protein ADK78_30165 [Kitasatospora aureofaciens]KEF01974.1 hypothetical protein DF17_36160 [Streptomyces rimosus]KEF17033.1 hypothetical protein DF18_31365 [Streptomyces rimosus]KOT34561.1 hypothetical protein ADK84_23535 [Streptomyces sp. NRRL WC-3701]KOT34938.1 hypothetical protein ADK42_21095 [Streptomyces rimosus subsp. rimosus]